MDQAIRNKLRGVVTQCRKLLEDSVSHELQGKFGIYTQKNAVQVDDDARMTHLSTEERAARKDILTYFEHIKARGFKPKDALDQLVREIAFTHLNRFCAYKMMEARQVYVGDQRFRDAVGKGVNSNGVKFYLAEHPEDERLYSTGKQDVAYRHYLDWLGGLLSEEIGVLFNPNDSANRLYPTQKVIDETLALLNDEALAEIWTQDETIGWVYQYFTPKEVRDEARKESAAPRNSYELAFRNQFFTPRYVVEFLTDNTLGRIWHEMRKGDTKFKNQCQYLVRRSNEVFLTEGEQPPKEIAAEQNDLAQEELLTKPVHIPHRPKKDPRELKLLDPACGSGHFLLYCFDLLLTIYEEAYDDPSLGPLLKKDFATLADFQRNIPNLILSRNLHGIDIDLRATQIAALALWLRCQRAYQDMGLKKERPKITRTNIVCAEPMPGEKVLLDEFLKTLREDRLEALIRHVMQVPKGNRVRATQSMADSLCELVRLVWDKMQLAGEAGSLLKIEEELQKAILKGQQEWEEKQPLFRVTEFSLRDAPKERHLRFVSDTGVSFWDRAESLVMAALHDFATYTKSGDQLQRRLFAEDATRGFAFADLCRQRFDVALMNPPFGDFTPIAADYVAYRYAASKADILCTFVDMACRRLLPTGLLGAITNRTQFFTAKGESWRRAFLLGDQGSTIYLFADLGHGVLDTALVEASAYCVTHGEAHEGITTLNVTSSIDKEKALLDGIRNHTARRVRHSALAALPSARFSYWLPSDAIACYKTFSSLAMSVSAVDKGMSTLDDFRFVRAAWEIPEAAKGKTWMLYAKGGEYSPFVADIHLVVDWTDGGRAISQSILDKCPYLEGNSDWVLHPESHHGCPGLTYTKRTTSSFSARLLPSGCRISDLANMIFDPDKQLLLAGC
jgi:hypothetical protein